MEHILHRQELSINAATGDIDLATSTPGTYTITYQFHAMEHVAIRQQLALRSMHFQQQRSLMQVLHIVQPELQL